jgi:hypothetical protein
LCHFGNFYVIHSSRMVEFGNGFSTMKYHNLNTNYWINLYHKIVIWQFWSIPLNKRSLFFFESAKFIKVSINTRSEEELEKSKHTRGIKSPYKAVSHKRQRTTNPPLQANNKEKTKPTPYIMDRHYSTPK